MKQAIRLQATVGVLQKQARPASVSCVVQYNGQQGRGRSLHTSSPKERAAAVSTHSISSSTSSPGVSSPPSKSTEVAGLAALPFSQVLRTYFITSISSSPRLLSVSTAVLRRMLNSRNPLFRIDTNPLMRALLWETFYKQFCAGESEKQVAKACADLRKQGYAGVILEYALEVLDYQDEGNEEADVKIWRQGMLDSVKMAAAGDYLGLKWSGMGPYAMRRMKAEEEPTERMSEAMHAVCKAAAAKNIALLPAAEETWSLTGFHNWSLSMQRVYNLGGKSVVHNTYQAYLKSIPQTLAQHLAIAKKEGFTLGVKMVRGAYLGTEKREFIYPTIEGTHKAYDGIAEALILRKYNDILKPTAESKADEPLENINVVLATHNAVSVQRAQQLRQEQASRDEVLTPLTFAQLQGMADEVSCALIATCKANKTSNAKHVDERVFKCTTWGPMFDCLNYLLRRAAENKDAAGRTSESRNAMRAEIWRRFKTGFGLMA